jgi:hypothetical protein
MRPLIALALFIACAVAADPIGAPVAYRLPTEGPLPRTYRVTLAIVDPKNPDWIISQFAAGVPRTVTAENGGRFTEAWDGLDDNFMPVPAGEYAAKGICMPAEKWLDGEYHSVTPRFVGGVSDWLPTPEEAGSRGEPFHGDPVGAPIGDVAVSPDGIAVFWYGYLENGLSNPLIDLRKPQGLGQFLRAFPSGGAGGGTSTCTDGESVWSFSQDGGNHVLRADGKDFGKSPRAMRRNSYQPDGWVTAMAAWRESGRTTVFIAQRGKLLVEGGSVSEGPEPLDIVTVHAGEGGAILATLPLARPRGLAARAGRLYGLHASGSGFAVSSVPLKEGVPDGAWSPVLALPAGMEPGGLTVDLSGRIYVSEPAANRVHQYSPAGKRLRSYGKLDAQRPGTYDRETFMAPTKLASWTDPEGKDRLLVVEQEGPCRVSEWSAEGALLREFPSLQTSANGGWAVDPANPSHAYVFGHRGWLSRFVIDYTSGRFALDALWPEVGTDPVMGCIEHPRMVRVQGRPYIACTSRGNRYSIYRLDGDRWKVAAGVVSVPQPKARPLLYRWSDRDGDGKAQEPEYSGSPMHLPGNVLRYHGEQIGDDLALLALNQGGRDAWRLPIARFDDRGVPILGEWQKVLTDPVFTARAEGTATALFGGNELAETFASDWGQCDGTPERGYWVTARGGKAISANHGTQEKVSCYVPDGKGGMRLRWRVGRSAFGHLPKPGETLGAMHIRAPMGGLVPVIDQTRCGVILYNEDGLYVDTLFPPGGSRLGIYDLPGEFFSGMVYPDPTGGGIYVGVGKDTPLVFRCDGWTVAGNPARPLPEVQRKVEITLAQIASPPEIALSVRGGAGKARLARFAPAFGGVEHDGSLSGWEQCDPVIFSADKDRTVEARCLWDAGHLHVRVHARTGAAFSPRALRPIERVFSHDRATDAVSFYIQGDPTAKAGGSRDGRPGDARIVLGLFDDAGTVRPAAIGFHPTWKGTGASPQSYQTPVGKMGFAHVGEVRGAVLGGAPDADGKGYVVSVSIPREALDLPPISPALRTTVDFEATFGGHVKFWWSDADGSASRETFDEPTEARLYPGAWAPAEFAAPENGGLVARNWLVCGPFGGPGAEKFSADPPGKMKQEVQAFYDKVVYPPESGFDPSAVFSGEMLSGWWGQARESRWQPASVADLDARVHMGKGGAQVWFATSWVRAETATAANLLVHGMNQGRVRVTVDDQQVYDGEPKAASVAHAWTRESLPITLPAGWHRIQLRSFSWGYGHAKAGIAIDAPIDQLWGLRLSGSPPRR